MKSLKIISAFLTISVISLSCAQTCTGGSCTENSDNGPIIGIDLGTTYSCVGIYDQGSVQIIQNDQGSRITPSYVSINSDGSISVGDAAKNQLTSNPENTIFDVKRFMGRKISDPEIQSDQKYLPFKLIPGPNDSVKIQVKSGQEYTPEQISAMVLSKMKEMAEQYTGRPISRAIVTVPAYFNDAQRQATKDAGRIAGLKVERIINEPTAAALAFGVDKTSQSGERNVLVYDLGGGTFDVSLLAIDQGVFEVLSTNGDTHLGGEDFDQRVMDWVMKMTKKTDFSKSETQKIRREAELAKRKLSSAFQTRIEIESMGIDLPITRAKFEELNSDLFRKTLVPVETVLKDAGLTKDDVDDIVLVGGSTRIPKIQKILKEFFNGKEPVRGVNPDEAVAFGAAIQGSIIEGKNADDGLVVIDITPLSLGIETVGGIMTKLVEKSTTIPVKKSQIFSTAEDNQSTVTIQVYQGERSMATDNQMLGKFDLTGISPAPRGTPQIEVTFNVDVNGILTITAMDKASAKSESLTVDQNKGALSEAEINELIEQAKKFEAEDKERKELVEAKLNFEGMAYQAKQQFSDNPEALKCCNDAITWLETNAEATQSQILDRKLQFENDIKEFSPSTNTKNENHSHDNL